ncbi:Aldo/keto reductase [Heliocybe sulcata]|uniref:Aldo/keto reductase n=1 Tax=Heliocybe sulcata TaxID=5364 RepID=A0A5C3N6U7_9AGAM|nr:Aldo/keto reductase [Heliocybe sulcata]
MAIVEFPKRKLGRNGPEVSAIGLGAMGIGAWYGKTDESKALEMLSSAADRGVTFWDTADVYGTSEATIGKWFSQTGRRSEIFLATKFGSFDMTPGAAPKPNSRPSYMKRQLENSLKELGTTYIDLWYQHRVDPEVPIEVVMETVKPLIEAGVVKYFGLSECSVEVLRRAKAVPGVGDKIIACQMEFSPFELEIEHTGFLSAARDLGVGVVAYSPLGRGLITGRLYKSRSDFDADDMRLIMPRFSEENMPKNLALLDKFSSVGEKYGAKPSQVALAWILNTYPDMVPIPGMRTIERLEENAKAADLVLSPEDLKELKSSVEAADVVGGRYPQEYAAIMVYDCITLGEWKGE